MNLLGSLLTTHSNWIGRSNLQWSNRVKRLRPWLAVHPTWALLLCLEVLFTLRQMAPRKRSRPRPSSSRSWRAKSSLIALIRLLGVISSHKSSAWSSLASRIKFLKRAQVLNTRLLVCPPPCRVDSSQAWFQQVWSLMGKSAVIRASWPLQLKIYTRDLTKGS